MPGQFPNPQDPHAGHTSTPADMVRLNHAKRHGLPLLTWRGGGGTLEILELDVCRRYSIGRRPSTSVVIDWDAKVSGLHAELAYIGGEWVICDDGLSRNGTWVNDDRIHGRSRLHDQDRVRIGACLIAFHDVVSEQSFTPTEAADDDSRPMFDRTDRDVLRELCRTWYATGEYQPVDNASIAKTLSLSIHTVKKRLGKMYDRCGIRGVRGNNRAALMYLVVQNGTVSPRDYEQARSPGEP